MDFQPVFSFTDYIEAHLVMGRLEEEGIRCWLKDEHTVTLNPIWTNAIGGIKLMVAEADVLRAKEILNEIRKDKQSKWSCKKCGSHNVQYVSTPRKAANWFSALITFFLGNFAMATDKVYHCFDCGFESEEIKEEAIEEIP